MNITVIVIVIVAALGVIWMTLRAQGGDPRKGGSDSGSDGGGVFMTGDSGPHSGDGHSHHSGGHDGGGHDGGGGGGGDGGGGD